MMFLTTDNWIDAAIVPNRGAEQGKSMKPNAIKVGLAAAYAVAIIWVFCSLLVVMLPGMAMNMGGYMMHADFSGMGWHMGITGFALGLILWSLTAGIFAWLMATIYNALI